MGQAVTLNQELMLVLIFFALADDGSDDHWNTFDYDVGQLRFELLHAEVHLLPRVVVWLNIQGVIAVKTDMTFFNFKFRCFDDGVSDSLDCHFELQCTDRVKV